METSFKFFEFVSDKNPTMVSRGVPFDTAYSVMENRSKVIHLIRQALIVRYYNMVFDNGELPMPFKSILQYTANLVDIKVSPSKKEDYDFVEEGLMLANKLLQNPIKDDDFFIVLINKFANDISNADKYKDVPVIGSVNFIKMFIKHNINQWHLRNKRLNNIDKESVFDVYLPVYSCDISDDRIHLFPNLKFKYYQFAEVKDKELVEFSNTISKYENIFSLMINLDWTNKNITDVVGMLATNAVTLDVFDPIKPSLLTSAFALQIVSGFTSSLVPSIFCSMPIDVIGNIYMRLIYFVYFLFKKYNISINDLDITNKLFCREAFSDITNRFNIPLYIKAYEEISNKYAAPTGSTEDAKDDELKKQIEEEVNGDTSDKKDETDNATEETKDDTTSSEENKTEESTEEQPPEEAKRLLTSKLNDKSRKVVLELSGEETLDSMLLRKEIMAYVTEAINNPPPELSTTKITLLTAIKRYWSNLLSIESLASIVANIIKIPIKFKTITE